MAVNTNTLAGILAASKKPTPAKPTVKPTTVQSAMAADKKATSAVIAAKPAPAPNPAPAKPKPVPTTKPTSAPGPKPATIAKAVTSTPTSSSSRASQVASGASGGTRSSTSSTGQVSGALPAPVSTAPTRTAAVAGGANGGNRSSASASGVVSRPTTTTRAAEVAGARAAGDTTAGGQRSSSTLSNWAESQGDRLLGNADWRAEGKAMGLSDATMQTYVDRSGSQPASTQGKSTAEIQASALGNDKSGLMEVGRTGLYFVPGLGTAYAAAEAVGGAQQNNADKALWNSVAAVLPMGLGAAGKIASKAAPKTTGKVTSVADRAAAKFNTKVVQPLNSKITSIIADPNTAADAAAKIIKDKQLSMRAVDKAAKDLPKNERNSWKNPSSAVDEAEGILRAANQKPKPGEGPTGGGSAGGRGGSRPGGPTLNYGPTGGVTATKAQGVQRVDYMGGGVYRGATQTTGGTRSLSGAQGAPRAQAGIMGTITRVEGGTTRVGQTTATLTRDPALVPGFGTRTTTQVPTSIAAPTRSKPGTARPTGPSAPTSPRPGNTTPTTKPGAPTPTTVRPGSPAPSKPGAPAPTRTPTPTVVPKPGPGTKSGPEVTPKPDVIPTPKPDTTVVPKPGPSPVPKPDVSVPPKVDVPTKPEVPGTPKVDDVVVPKPRDVVEPQPNTQIKPKPDLPPRQPDTGVNLKDPSSNPPTRTRLPRLPQVEGTPVYGGPVQSNWQDFRGTSGVVAKEAVQGGPQAATYSVGRSEKPTDSATDSTKTEGKDGAVGGRRGSASSWMYKNPTD